MLSLRAVHFTYPGADAPALQDISLTINAGERVLISGPSGCGKTTLALALSGLLGGDAADGLQGDILIHELDARTTPRARLAREVVLVTQNPELSFCTLTVRDELAFGQENLQVPPLEMEANSLAALRAVGAEHLLERWLDELSGGEQQKVAIAAALAMRPRTLILDEPTSNLDPKAAEAVALALDTISFAGTTVVVIEHHPQALNGWARRLLRMHAGQIVEDAPFHLIPEPLLPPAFQPPADAEVLIKSEGFTAGYDGKSVLTLGAFSLRAGEFVALLGANAAGKSTMLLALAGLLKPLQGSIFHNGLDLAAQPLSQSARFAAAVFQNPDRQLFCQSVMQECLYASQNFHIDAAHANVAAQTVLQKWDLWGKRAEHPYRLSYGQKRRLNVAAVLPHAPRVLLLDELFTGQDPAQCAALLEKVVTFTRAGGAALLVTHDARAAFTCASRVLFLENGRMLVDAAPKVAQECLLQLGKHAWLPREELRS